MAGWRDTLRQASFRGVPFQVEARELSGGRRGTLHEYPQRDLPWFQDMGRKARVYSVQAYILGDDYAQARDRLIEAAEKEGPADYVDQWGRGQSVVCRGFSLREEEREGRICVFTLDLAEAGPASAPSVTTDRRAGVLASADRAEQSAATSFSSGFSVQKRPAYVRGNAQQLVDRISNLLSGNPSSLGTTGTSALRPDFLRQSAGFSSSTGTLISSSGNLALRVASLMAGRTSLFGTLLGSSGRLALGDLFGASDFSLSRFNAIRALFGGLSPGEASAVARSYRSIGADVDSWAPVPRTTASRVREGENQDALALLVRRTALVNEARATTTADFLAYDDAIAWRDDLGTRLDAEADRAAEAGDDDGWRSLRDLRAASSGELTGRAADLSRVTPVTLPDTAPGLVVAYRLYQDLSREEEIVSRNGLRHPGFIPGGRPLQMLSAT